MTVIGDGERRSKDGDLFGRTDFPGRPQSPAHADEGIRHFPDDRIIGDGGHGVAADGDELDALGRHETEDVPRIGQDFLRRPRPVRIALGIADIDDIFMRQQHPQLGDDRQSADAGIKDANRLYITFHGPLPRPGQPLCLRHTWPVTSYNRPHRGGRLQSHAQFMRCHLQNPSCHPSRRWSS